MAGNGLTGRLMATIVIMLGLAMALQSMALIYYGVRAAIREEVGAAKGALMTVANTARGLPHDELVRRLTPPGATESGGPSFGCVAVTPPPTVAAPKPGCPHGEQHLLQAEAAMAEGRAMAGYAGHSWNIFFLGREAAIIAVPLFDDGRLVGALSAERPLSPIYDRYRGELRLAAVYLVVNLAVFGLLVFFRLDRSLFRPLDLLLRKTEEYGPEQQGFFPIREGDGAFRRLSLSFHGLLERIESDNRTLRTTVRKLEEVNRELRQRNDMVIRSEKLATAGRLSAGLAHEIGNPLSIIQGYVELLARDDLSAAERVRFSDKAQQELDRIKGLIRSLLDFARPGERQPEVVAAHGLLDDVLSFLSVQKSFAGCHVVTEYRAADDRVLVDRDALRQVLLNCLLNALDAIAGLGDREAEIVIATDNGRGSAGHGEVRTGTALQAGADRGNADHGARLGEEGSENGADSPASLPESPGDTLVVRIADNGLGIRGEDLPNIFDPFFTTKEGGRGTGLGLFVCHTIMERLGGSIDVTPRSQAEGVDVTLSLPLYSTLAARPSRRDGHPHEDR